MSETHEILLVDDDPDIRDSSRLMLEGAGYRVRLAVNGRDAQRELKVKLPDLMILDVMMSTDTEGFDLAHELRRNPLYRDLPIIIMTSFLDKVRSDGPDAYQHLMGEDWPARWLFEKPVTAEKLVGKIREILGDAPPRRSGSGA